MAPPTDCWGYMSEHNIRHLLRHPALSPNLLVRRRGGWPKPVPLLSMPRLAARLVRRPKRVVARRRRDVGFSQKPRPRPVRSTTQHLCHARRRCRMVSTGKREGRAGGGCREGMVFGVWRCELVGWCVPCPQRGDEA